MDVFNVAPAGKLPLSNEIVTVCEGSGSAAVNGNVTPLPESKTVYVPAAVLHTGSRSTVPAGLSIPLSPEGFTTLMSNVAPPT